MTSSEHASSSVRCGYADIPGGQIHYAEAGQGEPLLLLSATPRTHRVYRRILPLLAPHMRAIAVDTPGFGGSSPLAGKVTMEALGNSLVHLMDALGFPAVHLFGFHTGNKIAAALASGSPDRVLDVILAGQTHSILPGDGDREAGIRTFLGQYTAWHDSGQAGIDALRNWQGARATVERFWWPQALLQAKEVDPIDVESAEAKVIDYLEGRRSVMPMYDAIFAFDLPKAMEAIKARSLVLELLTAGEAHYGAQGPALCKRMQRAEYASLDNADGNVLESRPEDVARAIIRFIKRTAA